MTGTPPQNKDSKVVYGPAFPPPKKGAQPKKTTPEKSAQPAKATVVTKTVQADDLDKMIKQSGLRTNIAMSKQEMDHVKHKLALMIMEEG